MIYCDDVIERTKKLFDVGKDYDLVFADSPYNFGLDYGNGKHADLVTEEEFREWCKTWVCLCSNLLTHRGSFWIVTPEEWLFDFHRIATGFSNLKLRRLVTWYETFGMNQTNNFNRTSRFLLYFTKSKSNFIFNFNDKEARVQSARAAKYNDKRANPDGKLPDSVWTFPRVCGTYNERVNWPWCKAEPPTQLPEAMLERIIRLCSNKGSKILDPFAGTGTTLAVAKRLGRTCDGIEINADYVKGIKLRLKG